MLRPPTRVSAGDTVQRPTRDADHLLALERGDAAGPADVVVSPVSQPMVVALTPAHKWHSVHMGQRCGDFTTRTAVYMVGCWCFTSWQCLRSY